MAFDVEAIERKIDRAVTAGIELNEEMGGIPLRSYLQMQELAKSISTGTISLPKHFRGSPGDVLVVMMQAREWGMQPIALMNKTYAVNDRLAYESQAIHAVVEKNAPLTQRLEADFIGEGPTRQCVITGHLKGEPKPKLYTSPKIGDIKTKNSPLWTTDPDQQLFYYSTRAWARRWVPDILLGVYTKDEIEDNPEMLNVTPETPAIGSRLREQKAKSAEGFNTPKITQQMSEVVPDKIVHRETVTETRAATEDANRNTQASPVPIEPEPPREAVSEDESIRVMQEAQGSPAAGNNVKLTETPAKAEPAKAKREAKPKPPKPEPVKVETAFQRGTRLLPLQASKKDVEELQQSIAEELGSADAEQWIALCEDRIAELKP